MISDEYDGLNVFRQSVTKQLKSPEMKVQQIGAGVEELANAIDALEIYSYQSNLKIVGLSSVSEQESPNETLNLCLGLFQAAIGVREISAADVNISHRVPTSRASREGTENEDWLGTRRLTKKWYWKKGKVRKEGKGEHKALTQ